MSENNTKNSFGATNWNIETSNGYKPNQNNKDLYLRLEQGSNLVRLVTKPYEYLVHQNWKINPTDAGYGHRVMSSLFYDGKDILKEKYNSTPKRRWLVGVICRKTQSYKLLDISKSVFEGIRECVRTEEYGDPLNYDLDIKVDKQGGPASYYRVLPKPPKPLSPADLEIKQNVDLDDLKRRVTPPLPEVMESRVAAIIAKSGGIAPAVKTTVVTTQSSNDEDDNFDFPVVNG